MGGRGSGSIFSAITIDITGQYNSRSDISPLITAGLMELRGNEADSESTLKRIDEIKFRGMDHEQLYVVDRDGFVLKGYDGTADSVAFDTTIASEWADMAITHRHPGDFGGTLSIPDINCAAVYGWGTIEASAEEGRYQMTATSRADGSGLITQINQDLPRIQQMMRNAGQRIAKRRWASLDDFRNASVRAQLAIVENYYQQTLPQYGYTYTFTPREDDNK